MGVPEHGAEAARVVQAQYLGLRAVAHDQVEVIVFLQLGPERKHAQMARHAQVDDERACVETDQQVFTAPADLRDALAGQGDGQVGREGPAQALAPEHDLFDHAAFEVGRDAAPGHFYFGGVSGMKI